MADEADLTSTVARHYNELNEGGLEQRVLSRIFYLRNFNNWVKSGAIADALTRLRQNRSSGKVCVLDLCAGKGGDLLKWKKGRVDHVVCADIASISVEQCEARFKEMIERNKHERYPEKMFTAEFYSADCTKVHLKDMYKNPDTMFDLVSCQFSLHYGFESYQQAHVMLSNISDCLKPVVFSLVRFLIQMNL
jgi:mRNA (guanine-N7-)-methyltransferase